MNKDEIKKALERCISNDCDNCPYYYDDGCRDILIDAALNLITEQEKEIDFQVKDRARLQNELDELEMAYIQRAEELDYAKKDCDRAFQRLEAQQIKQAKIDVLNELKDKCGSVGVIMLTDHDINKMIEELKK